MFARLFLLIGAFALVASVAGAEALADKKRHHHLKRMHHHKIFHHKHHRQRACYKRVHVPAVYKTVKVEKRAHRGHCKRHYTPAVWEWKEKVVVIRPERTRHHRSRAVYKRVAEKKLVRAEKVVYRHKLFHRHHGKKVKHVRPAKYRTVYKKVLVTPAKQWTSKVPAKTKVRKYRVLAKPAKRWKVCEPPKVKVYEKKVKVARGYHKRVAVKCH